MELKEIQELIRLLESSSLSELEVEEAGRRIRLSRGHAQYAAPAPVFLSPGQGYAPPSAPSSLSPIESEDEGLAPGLLTIDSPMVGTFYAASAPGEPPFVLPGDVIEPNQTVCVVEAMKIMNEVGAKYAAVVEKVLVENGEPVEFGQPLFAVRPTE